MTSTTSWPRSSRVLLVAFVVMGLAIAGTAGAFFLRSRRDVTTSSELAAKLYREAVENELRLYEREAISGYAAALQQDPHFVMATVRLAEKIRTRDPERAKSLLASAARYRDEITPREQLNLRILEERWGRRDMKVLGTLYDEYVSRFPDDPEGYRMRANYFAGQNRTADAIAEYERLLAVNPNYAIAYNTLGYFWMERGDNAKAEDFLKRYRFLAPDQANPFDSLGELYERTGRYDEAEENLRKALAVKEDFVAAYGHLASVEVGRGHPDKAAVWFLKAADAVDTSMSRMEFRFFAVMTLFDAGKRDEARREFEAMDVEQRTLPPGNEAVVMEQQMAYRRALFLARWGDEKGAETALQAVAAAFHREADPEKAKGLENELLYLRGVLAGEAGQYADGARMLSEALEKQPASMGGTQYYEMRESARLLLSECLRRLGRMEDAEKALAPILARNPHFEPALEHLARVRGGDVPVAQARTKPAVSGPS